MNKQYWEEIYKNEQPSNFAKFCLRYIPSKSRIIDIGCGNGRDSYFFGEKDHIVLGVDYAFSPRNSINSTFRKQELKELLKTQVNWSVIYSRFFIHSITDKEIIALIRWSKGLFMTEFRDELDKPELYKDHKRNLIDGERIKQLLIKRGFEIVYYKKSRGLAKYRCEDPLIVRIIARKMKNNE